jgi:hypothetical protein
MAAFRFRERRTRRWWLAGTTLAAAAVLSVVFVAGSSATSSRNATATCSTLDTLDATGLSPSGGQSNFEIDKASSATVKNKTVNSAGANLTLEGASPCVDWLTTANGAGTGTDADLTSGVLVKPDSGTGSSDDSFTGGTSENDVTPIIASGSIPPNKSDLQDFGIYRESNNTSGKILNLFWSRLNSPSGTVDKDFELNKLACDGTAATCSDNAPANQQAKYVTPLRSNGDKLITYDLASGGTVPTISIYTWSGSATTGSWGTGTVISSGGPSGEALGAINFDQLAQKDTGGIGTKDPLTFGEVSISYKALFSGSGTCGTFGSVYLKSRSSNTFTDEMKDFISPEPVQITNCTTLSTQVTSATGTINTASTDTATLTGATANATGTISFNVYGPFSGSGTDVCDAAHLAPSGSGIAGSALSLEGDGSFTSTGSYTPTAVGRYRFVATYTSGDANNANAGPTLCLDGNELVTVSKVDTTLTTNQVLVPNDSATVSPGAASTNTAHFYLFKPGTTCSVANANLGTVAVISQTMNVSAAGLAGPTTNSSNTDTLAGSHANALGTWHWLVVYDGDSTHNGSNNIVNNVCSEAFTITDSATS